MCIGVQTAGLWLEVVRVFHAAAGVHRRAARFGAATAVVLRLVTNCGPSAVKVARLGTTYASDESSGPAHHARSDY